MALWREGVVARRAEAGFRSLHVATFVAEAAGQEGNALRTELERLLAADSHLRATCRRSFILGLALDTLLLGSLTDTEELASGGAYNERIAQQLLTRLFEDNYCRRMYFRLYNVSVDAPPIVLTVPSATIDVVPRERIPTLTGERTSSSTIHRQGTGDAFLVFEDPGVSDLDDYEWWFQCGTQAQVVLQVLRYLKSATVDLDYAVIHHTPEWVNEVRRYGIALGGRARLDVQDSKYQLAETDGVTIHKYLVAMARHAQLLADMRPSLRRAINTAGNYYEGHHSRTAPTDRLVDLVVSLEALFGTGSDIAYRVSLSTAVLLGQTSNEIEAILEFVREMYLLRNKLVHGGEAHIPPEKVNSLADIVRQAILRCAVLLARGDYRRERREFLQALARAVHDHELRAVIQGRSDVGTFLAEG